MISINKKIIIYENLGHIFSTKTKNNLEFYYLSKGLTKKFGRYMQKGIYVNFEVEDEKVVYRGISCYRVSHFNEISNRMASPIRIFYSIKRYHEQIKTLISRLSNLCFLDFEFNMQDFTPIRKFISEIIEVGIVVTNSDLVTLEQVSMFIQPTKFKKVTNRAIKFLNYNKKTVNNRLPYNEFYEKLKFIVSEYDPYFIVWGKGDIDLLYQSYSINKVKHIPIKFIDLSQIHVNYYNLKSTPGLFKTANKILNKVDIVQKHNALEDALITKLVFEEFKKDIKKDT